MNKKYFICCLLSVISVEFVFGQESCQNYYYQQGTCVPMTSCPSLNRMYSNPRKSFYDQIILDGSYCSESRGSVKVCCTDRGVTVPISLPTRTTTRRPIRVTSSRPVTSRLLPLPGSGACGIQTVDKIFGGEKTAINEHPWLALLQYTWPSRYKSFNCGGFLINDLYVMTAAHCIKNYNPVLTGVRLGEWNYKTNPDCQTIGVTTECSDTPQDFEIEKIIRHSGYSTQSDDNHNDIALLRLSKPAKLSHYVKPICLPSADDLQEIINYHGKIFTVAGWGFTEQNKTSDTKLKVDVPGVNKRDCQRAYDGWNRRIIDEQICAGGEIGKDSCGGDSGGPLMTTHVDGEGNRYYYVAGIVSYGPEICGTENVPGVYTRVASFMDWVQQEVKE